MRKLKMLQILVPGILGLALALAAPAAAGTLYKWTSDGGTVSFTDDPERIPARYSGQVRKIETQGLDGYARFTPRDQREDYQERLDARVERLRALNEPEEVAVVDRTTPVAGGGMILRLNENMAISVPNDQLSEDEPVVVENQRVRDRHGMTTTHLTVVRQGDRILSIVRPESAHNRGDWESEEELLGER